MNKRISSMVVLIAALLVAPTVAMAEIDRFVDVKAVAAAVQGGSESPALSKAATPR